MTKTLPRDRMLLVDTTTLDRLVNSGFLVALSNCSQETADCSARGEDGQGLWRQIHSYRVNPETERVEYLFRETWYVYMAIVRVPNVLQPHMGSDEPPCNLKDGKLVTTYRRNKRLWGLTPRKIDTVCWQHKGGGNDIMAYIVHKEVA